MAWTTPSTVVAGQTLSAAFWNEQVRDNSNFLYQPPMCVMTFTGLAHNNVAQVLNPTYTEEVDTDSMHVTGANNDRITLTTAGVYIISLFLNQTAGAATVMDCVILDSSSSAIVEQRTSLPGNGISISTCAKFTAGDYIRAYANNNGTATLSGRFCATWVGNA